MAEPQQHTHRHPKHTSALASYPHMKLHTPHTRPSQDEGYDPTKDKTATAQDREEFGAKPKGKGKKRIRCVLQQGV